MNWEILTYSNTIENLGWMLVHSIWQITFIALALFLILRFFTNFSANVRYVFSVFALVFTLALPLTTFVLLANNSAHNQSIEIFKAKNTSRIKGDTPPTENLFVFENNKSQIKNSSNENIFFSLENLQESFRQNFASVLPMLVLLWIFGIGFFTFRLLGGIWQLRRYKTQGTFEPKIELQEKFSNLRAKLKITQTVKLWRSNLVETPIVIGWLKPVILVPTSVFLQMHPQELETILAHELLHIRRYDNLVNFAQSFIEILFFYHPCARWISTVIKREREFACDDAVMETLESPRIVYADALANLEEIRRLTTQKTPPFAVAASGGKLMKRIERIIEKNAETHSSSKQSLWSAGLALLLISAVLISVFSATTRLSVNAENKTQNKKIAIGFVSIPPVDRMGSPPKDAEATARLLIEKLKLHKVPAIGFVLGASFSDGEKLSPARADIVRMWRDAGLEIGIGNFKHIWFYDTPYDEYVAGVERNEKVTRQILAEKNLPLTFFSYPFLNTGKSAEDKQKFEAWLKERSLRSVSYTFDNSEWMYSFAYDMARKDNDANTMKLIRTEFLAYMEKMLAHYEAYSQEMFGRDIAQTLVLTPSRLVADSSDELFGMFEQRGYKFVSMDEALTDEAYKTQENFVGKSGISWFERWTITQSKKLRDEPKVDEDVAKTWNERKVSK